tara:strand:+ start:3691 stop:4014 length:324 start_codon:yes stop_codon:yes gene_type:complete
MRNKLEIECALAEEMQHLDDPNHPMDEMQWANNQGWVEALEFVLDNHKERQEQKDQEERLNKILLTNKERSDIIGRAIKKSQSENESLIDDEDSEPCDVCTCGVNCT